VVGIPEDFQARAVGVGVGREAAMSKIYDNASVVRPPYVTPDMLVVFSA